MQHRISTTQRKLRRISLLLALAVGACGGGGRRQHCHPNFGYARCPLRVLRQIPDPPSPRHPHRHPAPAPASCSGPCTCTGSRACTRTRTCSGPCPGAVPAPAPRTIHAIQPGRSGYYPRGDPSCQGGPRSAAWQVAAQLSPGFRATRLSPGNSMPAVNRLASSSPSPGSPQSDGGFAVAGLTGGDWVIAWADQTTPCNTAQLYTIQTRRFSATGALVKDTTLVVPNGYAAIDPHLQVKAMPDGGYVIAWSGLVYSCPCSPPISVSRQTALPWATRYSYPTTPGRESTGSSRSFPLPMAPSLPYGGAAGRATSQSMCATSVRPALASVAKRSLRPAVSTTPLDVTATLLANGNIGVAWATIQEVRWQVVDPNGNFVGAMGELLVRPTAVDSLDAIDSAAAPQGFSVFYQVFTGTSRGTSAQITQLSIDDSGSVTGSAPVVGRSLSIDFAHYRSANRPGRCGLFYCGRKRRPLRGGFRDRRASRGRSQRARAVNGATTV